MAYEPSADKARRPQILCVGGGKGGTGKSMLAINLARVLATEDMRIVLADLDLGGANLHIMTGMRTCPRTIRDFLGGRVKDLNELLIPVDEMDFSLLPGGEDVAGMVQPNFGRKQKLLRHLYKLEADVVICDLGGNSGFDTMDVFNVADCGLIVVTPEPPTIQNAYGFMKASLLRKIWRSCEPHSGLRKMLDSIWNPASDAPLTSVDELRKMIEGVEPASVDAVNSVIRSCNWDLVVNKSSAEDAQRVFNALSAVTQRFLSVELTFMGHVQQDERVASALLSGHIPLLGRTVFAARAWEQLSERLEPVMAVGLNEEIRVADGIFHVQTEDLGDRVGAYHTLVFSGGRILFSKQVPYDSNILSNSVSNLKQDRVRFLHRMVIRGILGGKIKLEQDTASAGANLAAAL